ncbi:LysR family transcriptional regulator [Streptomyces sp. NPDC051109]|uniref:LysR family transcriptional regulator n=1 Tax=Streptomyces sp. NPDC051109 TaxID=3365642 RepID=UPI0037B70AA4
MVRPQRAAGRLGVVPSAVSRQIRRLERELGSSCSNAAPALYTCPVPGSGGCPKRPPSSGP